MLLNNKEIINRVSDLISKNDKIRTEDLLLNLKTRPTVPLYKVIPKDNFPTYQLYSGGLYKAVKYMWDNYCKDDDIVRLSCASDKNFSNFRNFKEHKSGYTSNIKFNRVDKFLLSYSKSSRAEYIDHRINISPIVDANIDFDRDTIDTKIYQVAHTLTTGDGCGSWSSINLVSENGYIRLLRPEECEKLHGWSGFLTAKGKDEKSKVYPLMESVRYRMIGNGVPSAMAASVINALTVNESKLDLMACFAGVGGMEHGISKGKFNIAGHIENDRRCQDVIRLNSDRPIFGDITKLDFNDLPSFDIATCGLVCKSWSTLGKSLGFGDDRGQLFYPLLDMLKVKKPKYFVIENVRGLITKHIDSFIFMCESLSDAGYNIDFSLLSSLDFGVPQNRERVFLVGRLR